MRLLNARTLFEKPEQPAGQDVLQGTPRNRRALKQPLVDYSGRLILRIWRKNQPHPFQLESSSMYHQLPFAPFKCCLGRRGREGKKRRHMELICMISLFPPKSEVKYCCYTYSILSGETGLCVRMHHCLFPKWKMYTTNWFPHTFSRVHKRNTKQKKIRRENTRQTRECDWMGFPSKSP